MDVLAVSCGVGDVLWVFANALDSMSACVMAGERVLAAAGVSGGG